MDKIVAFVKSWPAPLLGVLASVVTALADLPDGEVSPEVVVPAVVGAVIAFFVTPSSRVSSSNYVVRPKD